MCCEPSMSLLLVQATGQQLKLAWPAANLPWPCRSEHGWQLHSTGGCSWLEQRALVFPPRQEAYLPPAVALLEDA